ncbi:MAG: hypothetical protein RIC19_13615 [Phaeodactylibacter sp.]|uniref:GH36-type glycosyl hydrolase domain-containing protein n=1 Tax=Phaeodactylibacter sp. TaxID=1940289 RepID=UPI0032ED791D
MQFGYFDDQHKTYVITRPDTPKPWSNYLGDTRYGAIITNNAGGYSFYRSGGKGRFVRMRFNSVPLDQPGRYLYLHDLDSKDYWSTSWQPVGKPLEAFKSVCTHGMGFTRIDAAYSGVSSSVTYYVPLNAAYEVWQVRVKNDRQQPCRLRAFSYLEYAANWNAIDDLLNLQYVQYIARMEVKDGIIDHGTNVHIPEMPDDFDEKDQGRHTFQAMAGLDVSGFDTDREAFIGPYRTYANPIVVERGQCSGSLGYGDNPCGVLSGDLNLEPGEERTFCILVGIGKAEKEGQACRARYTEPGRVAQELTELQAHWTNQISGFEAQTPDADLNATINTWGIYNAVVTFNWSRAASLIYTGIDRDGLGYRDSVQDLMGIMHALPDAARERLELMISGQESTGGAKPVIYPITHKPGQEVPTPESEYRSDDCLWLFNAVPAYLKETGDLDFLNKVIPYSDEGEGTVLEHLRRAIQFNLDRTGQHGLPCGLKADWNDCLQFGATGESVFVAMQLRLALQVYAELSGLQQASEEVAWAEKQLSILDQNLQAHTWDGNWFRRGFRADGMIFGSAGSEEGQLFLNAQSWAVLSGAATPEQAQKAMDAVHERLFTPFGHKVCTPPYTKSDYTIVRAQLMNPGLKENGGIFMHPQGWAVMAAAMLRQNDRAYAYLRAFLPAAQNEKAEIREIEPYVLCQSTHAAPSPKAGVSRIPWLSGSATWMYYAATQYILGIQPDYQGLYIKPCLPKDWKEARVQRRFRGKNLAIRFIRSEDRKGTVNLNGQGMKAGFLPEALLKEQNTVEVYF